jgi:outer membrane receptor protein involved in Fe transport
MFPDGMTTGRIMANAGRTRSCGAEISLNYRPSDRWEINTSYGYTDARFREFNNGISDFSGKRIPYAPRNTFFAGVTYRQPMPAGSFLSDITANINCRGVGEIVWDEANTVTQPFYALAGASIAFNFDKDYSLSLWGENLTDTKYNTFYFVSIGNTFLQRGKPLCLGATLRMNF